MIDFSDKDKYYFWNTWRFSSNKGRQKWDFVLPEELKEIIKTEEDWQSPDGQNFLQNLDKAFIFDKNQNANTADKVFRYLKSKSNIDLSPNKENVGEFLQESVSNALFEGFSFYETLQEEDGNWAGDYGGPLFLMPGLVIASYITQRPFGKPMETLIKRNFWNHQNIDGGWGLHIEGKSTMFGTVMQYVCLRLLGEDSKHPDLQRARQWILNHGGATKIPQWGKFYLSLLNIYEWKGNDALLPEMWKFPKWLPIHPGKYWCHNRMIFLPMSYCFGKKVKAELTPLLKSLRNEIYDKPYAEINWQKAREEACSEDVFKPVSRWYKIFRPFLNGYEKIHSRSLRKNALKYVEDYIDHEDLHTNFINIGPVNQALNSICVWHHHGKESREFRNHSERWMDYLWIAEDGCKMGGYNGSQLWDTVFAGQALLESNLEEQFPKMAEKIYHFLDITQIDHNPVKNQKYWRDNTIGCWPFSTFEHAWAVSDCTSEGMKTALLYNEKSNIYKDEIITLGRLKPAVDWLLFMQNKDGGWASYERIRAPKWIEVFNPALLFENIMTEVTYTECSSATVQGLKEFSKYYDYKKNEILEAIHKAERFLMKKQNPDGSWYGCWGVCYTYGTWFGIEGLLSCGQEGYENGDPSKAIADSCNFLLQKQRNDGSWGESFESCVQHQYIEHEDGQIINTSWALLALMKAKHPDVLAIERGIRFILSRQEVNGDFPQEGISGVFNGNCMETYTSYRNVFPLWALARYSKIYGKPFKS